MLQWYGEALDEVNAGQERSGMEPDNPRAAKPTLARRCGHGPLA